MNKKLVASAVVAAGLAIGLAPSAHADDDINREVCLAVMAMGVNPNDGSGGKYALGMVQRYPDMTYNQATALVEQAYNSVQYHANPTCNGITIPPDY
ncbi:hypothetical protein [Mycolicibacterium sp.]|uniref:hypothetical protein n=1 Tax=Mycolicibacterium sp. TaxID=2320850 RepID=UPI003D0E118E